MLVWSTDFPILPNRTADDLLNLCRKWLCGSPHADWTNAEIPTTTPDEIVAKSKGLHSVALTKTNVGRETYCGFKHQWQDADGRNWATEICGWHTPNRFLVGIHLHCTTSATGMPLPSPKKPYVVKQLIEEMGGDIDGDVHVCAEPRHLDESEIDVAIRLLRGESDHYLPVIYASSTWENRPAFDSNRLAQWAAGMAHIVTEPSRRFSFILANRVDRTNPYEGAVAICWPGGAGRTTRLYPYEFSDPVRYATAIANTVQRALAGRRPDHHCTWDYLRELILRKKIETLRREGKTGIEEYIDAFDEEMALTKNRLEETERENGRLKAELANRARGSQFHTDGLLAPGSEQELFAGEKRDILARALTTALNNSQADGRVREVLQSLLKANPPSGESVRFEDGIRDAIGSCTNLGKKEWRALEEIGFSITDDGKHLKLVFRGDDRYTFAMAKTGSDWRGMKNWVSDVTKRLFK